MLEIRPLLTNMTKLLLKSSLCFALSLSIAGNAGAFTNGSEEELIINDFIDIQGQASAPTVSASNEGRLYFDSTTDEFQISENGGAFRGFGDYEEGGDPSTGDRTLGNQGAHGLGFLTNNTNQVQITSAGLVGIGDTTADAQLEVSVSGGGNVPLMISSDDANDGDMFNILNNGRLGLSDTTPDAQLELSISGGTTDPLMVSSDDANDGDILIVLDSGEVGISESSPDALLEISASGGVGTSLMKLSSDDGAPEDADIMEVNGTGQVIINSLPTGSTAEFNIENGAILASGTTGATPVSGGGTRMMWVPAKRAFRAGQVFTTQWDDANIGVNSFAVGSSPRASGDNSMSLGTFATASGQFSYVLGEEITASADQSMVIGLGRTAAAFDPITNNVAQSLMIGFDSDVPTFFVGPADGTEGSVGNVGIGLTNPSVDPPGTRLDMDGAMSWREQSTAPAVAPADQGRIYFDATDDRFKISEDGSAYKDIGGTAAALYTVTGPAGNLDLHDAAFVTIPWDGTTFEDTSFFNRTGSSVDVAVDGLYRITYNVVSERQSGDRLQVQCNIEIAGTIEARGASYTYMRSSDAVDYASNSGTGLFEIDAGQDIQIECRHGNGVDDAGDKEAFLVDNSPAGEGLSSLEVELVRTQDVP